MSVNITNRKLTINGKPINFDFDNCFFNHETKINHSLSPNGQFLFLYQRDPSRMEDHFSLINLSTCESQSFQMDYGEESDLCPVFTWSPDSARFAHVYSTFHPYLYIINEIEIINTATFERYRSFPPADCWCRHIKLHDRFLEIDNRILIAEPIGWITAELSHHIIPPLAKLVVDILNPRL